MLKQWLGLASVLAPAHAVLAQDAIPEPRVAAAQQTDQAGIEDIVVTASRREENIQRSALSIQALSTEALTRNNVTKPEDLNGLAPGVQVGTGGNYPQVYVRGVGNFSTNALAEGAVAFNLDGVYISQAQSTRGMFFDLERIEVLKGPQGTLYGRNASGGAINVITAKPKLGAIGGFAEAQLGNYSLKQVTGALNLPLGDTLAIRAAGQIIDRKGYLSDGYNDDEQQSARLQLLWKPRADFSLLLNGNYQHNGGKGTGAIVLPQLPGDKFRGSADPAVTAILRAQPGMGSILVTPATDGYLDYTTTSVGAELNWNMGFATLTVLPAYRDAILKERTYVPISRIDASQRSKQTSVEARLSNDGDSFKWVLGAYYFNLQQNDYGGRPAQLVVAGVNGQRSHPFDYNTRSYAFFGQATYGVTDTLRLTGGVRYTYERKIIDLALQAYTIASGTPPTACGAFSVFDPTIPVPPPLLCRRDIPVTGRLTYNNITWKVGVEYDLAPQSLAYASVSTGFKSGGFAQTPPPNQFRPEKLLAFDVGLKNRFMDNRLQLNLEAFYWKYKDHQEVTIGPTSLPGFNALITFNAGDATSYGADADLLFFLTPQDEFNLKVQYNKSNYDTFSYSGFGAQVTGCAVGPLVGGRQPVDCSGFPLIRAPLWTGTVGYNHVFDLPDGGSLRAGGNVEFASATYVTPDFLPLSRRDAYAVGNLDLTYTSPDKRVVIAAFIRNITNELIITGNTRSPFVTAANPLVGDPNGFFIGPVRPPRTYGGRIRFNF